MAVSGYSEYVQESMIVVHLVTAHANPIMCLWTNICRVKASWCVCIYLLWYNFFSIIAIVRKSM